MRLSCERIFPAPGTGDEYPAPEPQEAGMAVEGTGAMARRTAEAGRAPPAERHGGPSPALRTNRPAVPVSRPVERLVLVLWLVTGALLIGFVASTLLRASGTRSTFWDGWTGNLGYGGCPALCAIRAFPRRDQRAAWGTI